jgi:hypothetical protein
MSSLLLTLFLIPVIYVALISWLERYHQRREKRLLELAAEEEEEEDEAELVPERVTAHL